jgi:hypothetical protein
MGGLGKDLKAMAKEFFERPNTQKTIGVHFG